MILDSYGEQKSMQRARGVQLQCVTNRERKGTEPALGWRHGKVQDVIRCITNRILGHWRLQIEVLAVRRKDESIQGVFALVFTTTASARPLVGKKSWHPPHSIIQEHLVCLCIKQLTMSLFSDNRVSKHFSRSSQHFPKAQIVFSLTSLHNLVNSSLVFPAKRLQPLTSFSNLQIYNAGVDDWVAK